MRPGDTRIGPRPTGQAESRWSAFLHRYADPMQIVLLAVGIGRLYAPASGAPAAAKAPIVFRPDPLWLHPAEH